MKHTTSRGSITIFATLVIMLVAQLLFTLIEGARRLEFEKVLQMNTESVVESGFADYCSPLWEQYHLLGMTVDRTDGTFSWNNRAAEMIRLSRTNLGRGALDPTQGVSLLCADTTDVDVSAYQLLTDGDGAVFVQAVCAYMKENIGYEVVKELYNNFEGIRDAKRSVEESKTRAQSAGSEKARVQVADQKKTDRTRANQKKAEAEEGNILNVVSQAQQKGVLRLVLPEETKLSDLAISAENKVSKRKLNQGSIKYDQGSDWYDKTLLALYLCNYMSSYVNSKEDHALQYELEYLVGGKNSDVENLRATVGRLLLIRESLNMASLMASPDKQAQAETAAVILAGVTLNPAVIETVKDAILIAWAYVESVLDVRTLLDGGKIALIKSEASWTSSIENIPSLLSGYGKAKSCEATGLDYTRYMAVLMLFESEKKLAKRAMDLQEATVRVTDGYENFRMDHVVCKVKVQVTYEYRPLFLTFVSLLRDPAGTERIADDTIYCYFK